MAMRKWLIAGLLIVAIVVSGCTQNASPCPSRGELDQIINEAKESRNMALCEQLPNIPDCPNRDTCYSVYAMDNLEIEACNKLALGGKGTCKIDIAKKTNDTEICLSLTEGDLVNESPIISEMSLIYLKNYCIDQTARASGDETLCDQILPDPNPSPDLINLTPDYCKERIR